MCVFSCSLLNKSNIFEVCVFAAKNLVIKYKKINSGSFSTFCLKTNSCLFNDLLQNMEWGSENRFLNMSDPSTITEVGHYR